MRFVLDARAATDHFPGIGRYVVNLARTMWAIASNATSPLLRRREPSEPCTAISSAWKDQHEF
jgi:hypothetical protein